MLSASSAVARTENEDTDECGIADDMAYFQSFGFVVADPTSKPRGGGERVKLEKKVEPPAEPAPSSNLEAFETGAADRIPGGLLGSLAKNRASVAI